MMDQRTVELPDGRTVTLDDSVGRVRVVDHVPMVCELGMALRLGLGRAPDREWAAALFPLFELCPGEERPGRGEMLEGWPVFVWIGQQEAAKIVGLTTRQVQNLETKGLPCVGHGPTKRYALPHLPVWHRAYVSQSKPNRMPWEVATALRELERAREELRAARQAWGLE